MIQFVSWLAVQAMPADATPPVQCALVDGVKTGSANLVGNIMGLNNLAPWIIVVLVAIAVVVAVIPKTRRWVIGNLLWVVGIVIIGGVFVASALLFVPTTCPSV